MPRKPIKKGRPSAIKAGRSVPVKNKVSQEETRKKAVEAAYDALKSFFDGIIVVGYSLKTNKTKEGPEDIIQDVFSAGSYKVNDLADALAEVLSQKEDLNAVFSHAHIKAQLKPCGNCNHRRPVDGTDKMLGIAYLLTQAQMAKFRK